MPFTTSLLILDEVPAPDKNTLGEQIAELKGKIIGQRVLDAKGPTMETNVSAKGSVKGTQVNVSLPMLPVQHRQEYFMEKDKEY